MALITQQFPSFLGGYSQKPDFEKTPGTVNEFKNVYPDFTYGATKRPGCQFIHTIPVTNPENYYWFAYTPSAGGTYLVGITDGSIRVFDSLTGDEQTVPNTFQSYLTIGSPSDAWDAYRHVQTEKGVVIVNKQRIVGESPNLTPGTLTGTVTTMGELAEIASPTEGDIYFVTNAGETNDDLYVIYQGGAWEETTLPGESEGINITTAPHVLTFDGSSFNFTLINYANRVVGSLDTNPHPSFVGKTISNVFIYLNRLGFLSGPNVIMSQPLRADNTSLLQTRAVDFYAESTLVSSDADPIDINAASIRDIKLNSILPSRQGLVLFAQNEQLLLYSDSGIITPNTATVRSISQWDTNPTLEPVEIDNEIYFVGGTPPFNRYSRLVRMITRGLEEDPIITDTSKDVSDWIPSAINRFFSSSQEQLIGMHGYGAREVYFYRRFKKDGELVMENWFNWEFPFDVISINIASSNAFILGKNGDETFICFCKLNANPLTNPALGGPTAGTSLPVKPHLDLYTQADVSADGFTITPRQSDWIDDLDATVYTIITTNPITSFSIYDTIDAGFSTVLTNNGDGTFTSPYDLSEYTNQLIIGYAFEMRVEPPTLYFTNASFKDYSASLTISRVKIASSVAGAIAFQIKQLGRTEWNTVQEITDADIFYEANEVPIGQTKVFTIPIYRKNNHFQLAIRSISPYPATLVSMMWEGQYLPRSYNRS